MNRIKSFVLATAGIAGLVAVGTHASLATAAPSAQAVVAARHANFKQMGAAMKVLKDELAGSADKAKMLAAARTIADTGRRTGKLFPAGTGPSDVKTHALPDIWTNRAAFDADMKTMVAEADKLVVAARSGDAAAVGGQFKALGAACGACHRQFRADD